MARGSATHPRGEGEATAGRILSEIVGHVGRRTWPLEPDRRPGRHLGLSSKRGEIVHTLLGVISPNAFDFYQTRRRCS